MGSGKRKKIPPAIEAQVLTESRRRCCLCFHLDGETAANLQGQIAHIDRQRSNNVEPNLAYLCMPHHDNYDSKPSQSKGLTPTELRHAKRALYEHLRADGEASSAEPVRLTLKIERNLESFTDAEKAKVIEMLRVAAGIKGGINVVQVARGSVKLTVELSAEDASRIVKAFNEGRLPTHISRIEIAKEADSKVTFADQFRDRGVTREQAISVVKSPDRRTYYLDGREVEFSEAKCGLFTKTFGNTSEKRYVVLVMVAIENGLVTIIGALRASERDGIPSDPLPMQFLKPFLATHGFEIEVPGLGKSSLFLGGKLPSEYIGKFADPLEAIAAGQITKPVSRIAFVTQEAFELPIIQFACFFLTDSYGASPR